MPFVLRLPTTTGGGTEVASFTPFSVAGPLAVQDFGPRLYAFSDRPVARVLISVDQSPVGAPVVVDLLRNGGASIFPGAKPTIAPGDNTDIVELEDVVLAQEEYLKLRIVSVGSEVPGSHLTIQMEG